MDLQEDNIKKVLIVGAGGIGSWLAENIHKYQAAQHLDVEITLIDDDTVDFKNLRYQNFLKTDLTDNKAEVLANRYKFNWRAKRVNDTTDLKDFDCIISAVDNIQFRKLLFKYAADNDTYFIDLRSEGRTIAFYTKHKKNTLDYLLASLPTSTENGSCQLAFELENNIVQNGNRIIAQIGTQLLLNWYRNEKNQAEFSQRF